MTELKDISPRKHKPLVSVVTTAYNHEPYIRECIEGVLSQQTDFPFEFIIHDDASTDGTLAIVKEYAEKYPHIIRLIAQTENQYSKGTDIWHQIVFPAAEGKYVALCEGDDYWTDPHKLQIQTAFLENHQEYSMTFHSTKLWTFGHIKEDPTWQYPDSQDASLSDIIAKGGRFCPTASILLRKDILPQYPPKALESYVGDYPLQIYCALRGKVYFFKETMCVYRLGHAGSWTQKARQQSHEELRDRALNEVEMLKTLDEYSGHAFHALFSQKINDTWINTLTIIGDRKELLKNEALIKGMSFKFRKRFFFIKYRIHFLLELSHIFKKLSRRFKSKNSPQNPS